MIRRIQFNDGFTSEVTPSAIIPSGRSIFTGSSVPDNSLGNDGDIYLQADGTIYLKTSGVWNVDSTLLKEVIEDAQDAADAANQAATDAATAISEMESDAADTLAQITADAETAIQDAIDDFNSRVYLKEKLNVISTIALNSWITIPNSKVYYTNKISVALNGMLLCEGEDYELDTASGARTQIKNIWGNFIPGDLVTFTIYN